MDNAFLESSNPSDGNFCVVTFLGRAVLCSAAKHGVCPPSFPPRRKNATALLECEHCFSEANPERNDAHTGSYAMYRPARGARQYDECLCLCTYAVRPLWLLFNLPTRQAFCAKFACAVVQKHKRRHTEALATVSKIISSEKRMSGPGKCRCQKEAMQ